jgi:hypothetical protein
MRIGIVGSEEIKFTPQTRRAAHAVIHALLRPGDSVVSGGCHLGGIDIWAAKIGRKLGLKTKEYLPKKLNWTGYKARNIRIAKASDLVVCITVRKLPKKYRGMRFPMCYHCGTDKHIKSGGCWTVKYAKGLGKETRVVVL